MRKEFVPFILSLFIIHTQAVAKDTLVCAMQNLSFPAGIAGSSYQWQIQREGDSSFTSLNGDVIYNNTTSPSLTIIKAPSYIGGSMYRCAVTGANGVTYSDTIRIRITATWTGTIDSNWRNKQNWSCGVIPDEHTEVFVPAVAHAQGHDLNVYTDMNVKRIFVLPDADIKVDSPASVVIWGDELLLCAFDTLQCMLGRKWSAYRGYIGDLQLDSTECYNTGECPGFGGEVCRNVDSLFMTFNFDNTGTLHFYVHEWGTYNAECEPEFNTTTELVKNFTWSRTGLPAQINIMFEGGLASEDEGVLLFHVLNIQGNSLHLYAELQPEPDDLYFNVTFR